MMEYPYLSIDKDGTAYECKTKPINNGLGKWFTSEIFGSDNSMRIIKTFDESNYKNVFK